MLCGQRVSPAANKLPCRVCDDAELDAVPTIYLYKDATFAIDWLYDAQLLVQPAG